MRIENYNELKKGKSFSYHSYLRACLHDCKWGKLSYVM